MKKSEEEINRVLQYLFENGATSEDKRIANLESIGDSTHGIIEVILDPRNGNYLFTNFVAYEKTEVINTDPEKKPGLMTLIGVRNSYRYLVELSGDGREIRRIVKDGIYQGPSFPFTIESNTSLESSLLYMANPEWVKELSLNDKVKANPKTVLEESIRKIYPLLCT